MKLLKRLYDWVLSLAEKPFGSISLFILAFTEASCFPIPPDLLLIALILGHRKNAFKFATICTVASVIGGLAGYFIGFKLWHLTSSFFFTYVPGFSEAVFANMKAQYDKWSFVIVFTSGFTPIPYKIFTISSGVFNINIYGFLIASVLGRGLRFYMVGFLVGKFGNPIKDFIDKYFNLLTIVFTIIFIGGFLLSKILLSN